MPGLTVFGHIAILVGSLFLGLHYSLIVCTQPFWGDLAIGALCVVTASGYALIKAPRNLLTRFLVRTAFFWSGVAFLAGLAFAGQFMLAQAGFLVGTGRRGCRPSCSAGSAFCGPGTPAWSFGG